MMEYESFKTWQKEDYSISTDPERLDVPFIHDFLSHSYWAEGIALEKVRKSIHHSLCFGLYYKKKQVGFAQVVTDRSVFGYLMNVFVIPEYRGKGLGKWLMECILDHPDITGLRSIMLATRDAHDLYARFGFKTLDDPGKFMRLKRDDQ